MSILPQCCLSWVVKLWKMRCISRCWKSHYFLCFSQASKANVTPLKTVPFRTSAVSCEMQNLKCPSGNVESVELWKRVWLQKYGINVPLRTFLNKNAKASTILIAQSQPLFWNCSIYSGIAAGVIACHSDHSRRPHHDCFVALVTSLEANGTSASPLRLGQLQQNFPRPMGIVPTKFK